MTEIGLFLSSYTSRGVGSGNIASDWATAALPTIASGAIKFLGRSMKNTDERLLGNPVAPGGKGVVVDGVGVGNGGRVDSAAVCIDRM